MYVREAVVCLDCDTIYRQEDEFCPRCASRSMVELRRYFPAKDITTRENIENLKKWRIEQRQLKKKQEDSKRLTRGWFFDLFSFVHLNCFSSSKT